MTPGIEQISRKLTQKETAILKKLRTKNERELKEKIKIHYFVIALLLGIAFAYLYSIVKVGFLIFMFGTLAVFSFAFIVFTPYELYKDRKNSKKIIDQINSFLNKNQLRVIPVDALQIAIAKEYEDEGELFIVEYDPNNTLYLWAYDYHSSKEFPCLKFEVYEEDFFNLTGWQFNPISEKIQPVEINGKMKWAYFKKYGAPGDLTTEIVGFDDLVRKFKNVIIE